MQPVIYSGDSNMAGKSPISDLVMEAPGFAGKILELNGAFSRRANDYRRVDNPPIIQSLMTRTTANREFNAILMLVGGIPTPMKI